MNFVHLEEDPREIHPTLRPETGDLNKLFVYGIFLGKSYRDSYGMTNSRYTTVKNYATVPIGGHIVAATPLKGYDLTGLIVEVDPNFWTRIDALEGAYDRIKVQTFWGEAWMYVKPPKEAYVKPS